MFDRDTQFRFEPMPAGESRNGRPDDWMTRGLIGSAALHLLVVLLLVFGLPWTPAPPEVAQIVSVNLVQLGEKTASSSSPQIAPLPQEKAREVATSAPAASVPVAQTPPPPAAPHRGEERPSSDLLTAVRPERKPAVPRPVTAPKPHAPETAKLRRQKLPADDLGTRLKLLARLRQPAPPLPPSPRQQEGSGASNLTAASAPAARARDAAYGVKDFIRAQVERRWNLDGNRLKDGDWVVAIHIVLSPDGRVRLAEIVDDPHYAADSAYRAFALSARNAVLLSSPLTVPPGDYDIAKDIVLDFNSRQVLQ